ncbi:MAG: hypothetical protein KJ939_01240, partial [Nanoarchaeota archaeon]|nr:hypothetical protein [Nanoarchaeota archaeon]
MVDKSKQGIEIEGDYVYKEHGSLAEAELERDVASMYSNNALIPIRTAEYGNPVKRRGTIYLPMKKIEGKSLMGNTDSSLRSLLVRDLALFHTMFAQEPNANGSSVIYRDAINSNYLMDDEGLVHIDFSSSNKLVHSFDDLALLIHPLWGESTETERKELVKEYLEHRARFDASKLSGIKRISAEQIVNLTPEERRISYQESIANMESQGIDAGDLAQAIDYVDFENLVAND